MIDGFDPKPMMDAPLITRHPDLLETTLDNEVVLMSIERGSYYGLENTARRIWQLIEQPRTKADLVQVLASEYDAAPEQIAQDIESFLQKLLDHGIVTLA